MNDVYSFLKYCCNKVGETERLIRFIALLLNVFQPNIGFIANLSPFN